MKKNVRILAAVVVVAAVAVGGYFLAGGSGLLGCIGRGCSRAPSSTTDFAISGISWDNMSSKNNGSSKGYDRVTVHFENKASVPTIADMSVVYSGGYLGDNDMQSKEIASTYAMDKVKDTTKFISNDFFISSFCESHRILNSQIDFVLDKDNKIKENDESNNAMGIDFTQNCATEAATTRAEFAKALAIEVANFYGDKLKNTQLGCFKDLIGNWAEPYACYLNSKGIVKGYVDGTYGPKNSMTRAEGIKMLNLADALVKPTVTFPANAQVAYNDIGGGEWYDSWVQGAAYLGLTDVAPFKGLNFRPNDLLTNKEAHFMMNNLHQNTCNNGVSCKFW